MALPDLEAMSLEEHIEWRTRRREEMRRAGDELAESNVILERQITQRRKDEKREAYEQRVTPSPARLSSGGDA